MISVFFRSRSAHIGCMAKIKLYDCIHEHPLPWQWSAFALSTDGGSYVSPEVYIATNWRNPYSKKKKIWAKCPMMDFFWIRIPLECSDVDCPSFKTSLAPTLRNNCNQRFFVGISGNECKGLSQDNQWPIERHTFSTPHLNLNSNFLIIEEKISEIKSCRYGKNDSRKINFSKIQGPNTNQHYYITICLLGEADKQVVI